MMAFQGYSNGEFTISDSKVKALSNLIRHGTDILLSTIPTPSISMNVLNLEECELLSDSKYRAYISQVDKALKNFEYTSEWADLISALGKLNKVLSTHVKYPVIPKRVTIGKRLAQCLHPALPSGVHLKALETYDIIFKCIGTSRLAADLFTYSAGLFPLLAYAAMNVKPTLLQLYETHFVQLGKHIKPALTGLLLGLLPGLEEGSEYFDRTAHVLDDFCEAAEPVYFYGCLWECILSSPVVRLPGINYVLRRYNRKQTMEDQLHLMGTNIDLLIEALCVSVQDTSVLVQRSALDLLLIGFPMHNGQLTRSDMLKVITAAVKVVLRRDMSLNRRLYAWLLGTDSTGNPIYTTMHAHTDSTKRGHERRESISTQSSEFDLDYFNTYTKELLITGVKNCIHEESPPQDFYSQERTANLRPFRILISLLDKPEIGSSILEEILLEIFRYMYKECMAVTSTEQTATDDGSLSLKFATLCGPVKFRKREQKLQKEDKSVTMEIIKTANLLFGAFEPYFIWDFIGRTFERACANCENTRGSVPGKGDMSLEEICNLVSFLLDKISLETYLEIQTEHLPELLRQITVSLTTHCDKLADHELTISLKLCSKLLGKVLPSINPVGASDLDSSQHGSPWKRHPFLQPEGEDGLSESDVFISADSDSMELKDSSPMEESSKNGSFKPKLDENENKAEDVDIRGRADTGDSILTDRTQGSANETISKSEDTESFNDFVQYGDVSSDIVTPIKMPLSPNRVLQKHVSVDRNAPTLMQTCVSCFQKLFARIVSSRIIKNVDLPATLMQQLLLSPGSSGELFCSHTKMQQSGVKKPTLSSVNVGDLSPEACESFSGACQLLIDFSSFPMYCTNYHKVLQSSFKADVDFPEWLQYLLTCACFVDHFQIQSSAISTMLDLISITRSVIEESECKVDQGHEVRDDERPRSASEGTISVVIIPSITPQHLQYINDKTYFYKILAVNLWENLSDDKPQCHVQSVVLLFQLHQLAPDPWVCEDVIGNSMLSSNKAVRISAYKRFTTLWHLLRDKVLGLCSGSKKMRMFDRSMFVMMDSLQSDTHPCRSIAQTWLTHTIQRGDIARLLEPILLILLHPDTARISIQHVSIHKPKHLSLSSDASDNQSECSETKIYAISSEGGNVIYHISNAGRPIGKHTPGEFHSFALTSISDGAPGTETARHKVETEIHFEKVDPNNLKLRINPFGSQHSLDRLIFDGIDIPGLVPSSFGSRGRVGSSSSMENFPDLHKIRRLDAETCKREGIFFDDNELSEEETEKSMGEHTDEETTNQKNADIESTEDIVRSILEEIINRVIESEAEVAPSNIVVKTDRSRNSSSTSKESELASNPADDDDDELSEVDRPLEADLGGVKVVHQEEVTNVHPLHNHILLYTQKYDSQRTLYALSCLKSIIAANPHLVTCSLSTTSLSNANTPHLAELQNLLIRHRRSVFGKNFFSEVPGDMQGAFRGAMLLEILISVCLYFIRSYYPNLLMTKMSEAELNGNREVQILSCEILMMLLSEMINVAKESGRGFSTYISDLLTRCKVQKALLHCVLASVHVKEGTHDGSNFTEALIGFNEEHMDVSVNETFQIKLLHLLLVVIVLEDQIHKSQSDDFSALLPLEWDKIRLNFQQPLSALRFAQSRPVIYQRMLLSAILSALKQQHMTNMHHHWISMVTSAMPYFQRALSHVVVTVVNQLCENIELLAPLYEMGDMNKGSSCQPSHVPPDHLVSMLESMTTMCHYCLLDGTQQDALVAQQIPGTSNAIMTDSATAGHILSNLMSVFNPYGTNRESSPAKDATPDINPVIEARRHLLNILPRIIASLSNLWKAVKVSEEKAPPGGKDRASWAMGHPKTIRKHILEFLSPISKHHGVNLMASVAIVWNDRRHRSSMCSKRFSESDSFSQSYSYYFNSHQESSSGEERIFLNRIVGTVMPPSRLHLVLPQAGDDQLLLVDLISSIKMLPTDTLIQMVKSVLKQPPAPSADTNKKRTPVEVSLLQFFYSYIQRTPGSQLHDSWPSLLSLLKDGLQLMLTPPGVFLLLVILNEFLQKMPEMFKDKKDQKDLQEIAQKLLEACSEIAGASLEQTTFFRRNLAVKPGPQVDVTVIDVDDVATDPESEEVVPPVISELKDQQAANRQYSVQALVIMAELTAGLLDMVYSGEEKDKVLPLLYSIMHNVFPYLKNHSVHNLPSFRACCQLLGSLSSFPNTRKAWRKEAFELLMDSAFFQMDELCIPYWRVIVDNLMTHDKTTFRDLLARVPVTQGTSLNLFSSREAEFEQKAHLLKRMSFTIFCSEVDQYQRSMPEIQERLSDSLRMPTVPSLQAQVFMCFRVLLLRISSQHVTSLWPTIITELIQVLLQIEQELCPEIEETKAHTTRLGNVDPSWSLGNGLNTRNNHGWLKLYLAACKLLDLALVLPAEQLPQFQLYRWAFTGDPGASPSEGSSRHYRDHHPGFVPHVIRLARLFNNKFGDVPLLPFTLGRPLLTISYIKSVQDLHSFFHTVATLAQSGEALLPSTSRKERPDMRMPKSLSAPDMHQIDNISAYNNHRMYRAKSAQLEIEQIIEWDFLEPLPQGN